MESPQVVSPEETKIHQRMHEEQRYTPTSSTPPFPKTVLVEISNLCNHRCTFCAYSKMTRAGKQIDLALLDRLLKEAYALGSREVGLYSGAEPFTSPNLEAIIKNAKEIGYDYIFITTNGSLANEKRLKACIDNGLDSIKFSINAGDRETYKQVHGHDHFHRVLKNVEFVSQYRQLCAPNLYLAISFVTIDRPDCSNQATQTSLKQNVGDLVDEIIFVEASNENGQMIGLAPMEIEPPCALPFNRVHISAEGYLRTCCNDYQNYLALVDLNRTTLKDAWLAEPFLEMRQRHLENRLEGTLCYNCINNINSPIEPVVAELATAVDKRFFDFQQPELTRAGS